MESKETAKAAAPSDVRGRAISHTNKPKGQTRLKPSTSKYRNQVLLPFAKKAIDNGLSVITTNSQKQPRPTPTHGRPNRDGWEKFQKTITSKNAIQSDLNKYTFGIGIVCGKVSGGGENMALDCLDIDSKHDADIYDALCKSIDKVNPSLGSKLKLQTATINGGRHFIYRYPTTEPRGNVTLAYNSQGKKVIETRGEGGYFVAPPSQGYTILTGSFDSIPILSAREVNDLTKASQSLCKKPKPTKSHRPKASEYRNFSDNFEQWVINNALSAVRGASESAKHDALRDSALALGGYSSLISENEAVRLLLEALSNKDVRDWKNAERTAIWGYRKGAERPWDIEVEKQKYLSLQSNESQLKRGVWGFEKYLSESAKLEEVLMKAGGFGKAIMMSPAGSGKTRHVMETCARIAKERLEYKFIFAVPYTLIAKQLGESKEYAHLKLPCIIGGSTDEEIAEADQSPLSVCSYDSIKKLQTDNLKAIGVDEAHNLILQYGFRFNAINYLFDVIEQTESAMLISATPPKHLHLLGGKWRKIKFQRATNPSITAIPIFYSAKSNKKEGIEKSNRKTVLLARLLKHDYSEGIGIAQHNNKGDLQDIKKSLVEAKVLRDSEISIIYSDKDVEESEDYTSIAVDSLVKEGVKLVLCTSKCNDGVNINNPNIRFFYGEDKDSDLAIQLVARGRRAEKLDFFIITKDEKKERDNTDYESLIKSDIKRYKPIAETLNKLEGVLGTVATQSNVDGLLNSFKDYVKKDGVLSVFEGGQGKTEMLQNYIRKNKDGKWVVNRLFILHKWRNVENSKINFEQFLERLEATGYIKRGEPIYFNEAKNEALTELSQARKEEANKALKSGIELISSENQTDLFLSSVFFQTRNKEIRGLIENFLGRQPTDSPQLVMFESEHKDIMQRPNVRRLGTVYIKMRNYGFSESESLGIMREDGFTSKVKFANFESQLQYHTLRHFRDTEGLISSELSALNLKRLDKCREALKGLGKTFKSHEAIRAISKVNGNSNAKETGRIIELLFNNIKELEGKERTVTYYIQSDKRIADIGLKYGFDPEKHIKGVTEKPKDEAKTPITASIVGERIQTHHHLIHLSF